MALASNASVNDDQRPRSGRPSPLTPYKPEHHVRIVTAASLFDGHDAAINVMRRIMQAGGANKDDAFVQQALANRTQRVDGDSPDATPIRGVEGGATAASGPPRSRCARCRRPRPRRSRSSRR